MKFSFNKYVFAFLLLLLLGVLLRSVYLVEFSDSIFFSNPVGTAAVEYCTWAAEICGGTFLWANTNTNAPLYAYFLAFMRTITANNYFIIRLFQELLGFAAFIPLYWLFAYSVKKYGPDKNNFIFYGTMFLTACYIPLIFYQGEIIGEALLIPLLCLMLTALYKAEILYEQNAKRKAFMYFGLSGVLAGACVLTETFSLIFIGFEIVYMIWRYILRIKDFKTAIFFILPLVMILLPVSIYNSVISEKIIIMQGRGAFDFFLGNSKASNGTPETEQYKTQKEAELASASGKIFSEAYFLKESFAYIAQNPLDWFLLCGKKALYVWNFRDLPSDFDAPQFRYYTEIQKKFSWLPAVLFILTLPGFLLCLTRKEDRGPYRHFIFLLAAFWLAQIVFTTSARDRLPMLPACFAFAIYFIYMMKIYSGLKKGSLRLVALEAMACVIVFLPFPKSNSKKVESEKTGLSAKILLENEETDSKNTH